LRWQISAKKNGAARPSRLLKKATAPYFEKRLP
jgi:hypothetical protein